MCNPCEITVQRSDLNVTECVKFQKKSKNKQPYYIAPILCIDVYTGLVKFDVHNLCITLHVFT